VEPLFEQNSQPHARTHSSHAFFLAKTFSLERVGSVVVGIGRKGRSQLRGLRAPVASVPPTPFLPSFPLMSQGGEPLRIPAPARQNTLDVQRLLGSGLLVAGCRLHIAAAGGCVGWIRGTWVGRRGTGGMGARDAASGRWWEGDY